MKYNKICLTRQRKRIKTKGWLINIMEEHIGVQGQIWGLVFLAELTAFNMADISASAQAFAYLCGGIASIATAYYYIFKKK